MLFLKGLLLNLTSICANAQPDSRCRPANTPLSAVNAWHLCNRNKACMNFSLYDSFLPDHGTDYKVSDMNVF